MRRVFFAISFDEATNRQLAQVQRSIQPLLSRGRFTDAGSFHLTLQFVGEIEEEQLEGLMNQQVHQQVLTEPPTSVPTSVPTSPFSLCMCGLGSFEKRRRHILWVGLESNNTLHALAMGLRACLAGKGFSTATPFHPHVTLARECVFTDEAAQAAYRNRKVALPPVSVEAYTLMESKRIEGRLVYLPLKHFPLKDLPHYHSLF